MISLVAERPPVGIAGAHQRLQGILGLDAARPPLGDDRAMRAAMAPRARSRRREAGSGRCGLKKVRRFMPPSRSW